MQELANTALVADCELDAATSGGAWREFDGGGVDFVLLHLTATAETGPEECLDHGMSERFNPAGAVASPFENPPALDDATWSRLLQHSEAISQTRGLTELAGRVARRCITGQVGLLDHPSVAAFDEKNDKPSAYDPKVAFEALVKDLFSRLEAAK